MRDHGHTVARPRLDEVTIRSETGCNVVAFTAEDGMAINPSPNEVLKRDGESILIGTADSEERFLAEHGG